MLDRGAVPGLMLLLLVVVMVLALRAVSLVRERARCISGRVGRWPS